MKLPLGMVFGMAVAKLAFQTPEDAGKPVTKRFMSTIRRDIHARKEEHQMLQVRQACAH